MKHHLPPAAQLPHSRAQRWLLAYDIRDPKRLSRVGRYIRKEGVSLQYSVYLLTGNRQQIEDVINKLRQLIDERTDDVRLYPITENTRIWGLGTQFDDDGNTLCDAFLDTLVQSEHGQSTARQADDGLNFSA
jgi:CRISPR-associated protein Cas2